jgi:hypothetical protein
MCDAIKLNGQRCGKTIRQDGLCGRHIAVLRRRIAHDTIEQLWNHIADNIWIHDVLDVEFLMIPVFTAVVEERIPPHASIEIHDAIVDEIAMRRQVHFHGGIPHPEADNRPELQRLADDRQNVHTGPVNRQTEASLTRLLETPIPPSQTTLAELWKLVKSKRVQKDVQKWYDVESCRQDRDWLYRKALNGLWARIKTSEHKVELEKRLVEEMTESVGMCCDGHIARLCNVLVGFDDLFVPQVSTGEALQQKISAIASLDISVEAKVVEAWNVFEELAIPMDDRLPWIDAF